MAKANALPLNKHLILPVDAADSPMLKSIFLSRLLDPSTQITQRFRATVEKFCIMLLSAIEMDQKLVSSSHLSITKSQVKFLKRIELNEMRESLQNSGSAAAKPRSPVVSQSQKDLFTLIENIQKIQTHESHKLKHLNESVIEIAQRLSRDHQSDLPANLEARL